MHVPRPRWRATDASSRQRRVRARCQLNEKARCPEGARCVGRRHLRRLYGRRALPWRLVRPVTLALGTAWTQDVYRRRPADRRRRRRVLARPDSRSSTLAALRHAVSGPRSISIASSMPWRDVTLTATVGRPPATSWPPTSWQGLTCWSTRLTGRCARAGMRAPAASTTSLPSSPTPEWSRRERAPCRRHRIRNRPCSGCRAVRRPSGSPATDRTSSSPSERGHRFKRLLGPLADPMVALLLLAAPDLPADRRDHRRDRGVRRARPDRGGRLAARVPRRTHPRAAPPAHRPHRHGRARRHRTVGPGRHARRRRSRARPRRRRRARRRRARRADPAARRRVGAHRRVAAGQQADRHRRRRVDGVGRHHRAVGTSPGSDHRHGDRHPVRADRHAGGRRTFAAHAAAAGPGPPRTRPRRARCRVLRRGDRRRAPPRRRVGRRRDRRGQPRHRRHPRRVLDDLHALPRARGVAARPGTRPRAATARASRPSGRRR